MANRIRDAKERPFNFWKSKPVQKLGERVVDSTMIKSREYLVEKYGKDTPHQIPPGYDWVVIDINSDQLSRVVDFLNRNYRSDYTIDITVEKLRWETMNKGFFVCVQCPTLSPVADTVQNTVQNTVQYRDLVSCIGITERTLQINTSIELVCEAIYLCCTPQFRDSGVTKVLINEAMRLAILAGYNIGSFCTDVVVPSPIATVRYYTRPLNYKYLKANDFVSVGEVDDELAGDRLKIKLRPPKSVYIAEKTAENIQKVFELYNAYMTTFNLHNVLTVEEIENYFFDQRYVKTVFYENDNGDVVDFLCYKFYTITNTTRTVTPDDKYGNQIKAANIFMYSSNFLRPDILLINAFKVISLEKHHLVYIPDMMGSTELILSPIKKSDEDTLDEEENALYDQQIIKSIKKQFINLVNWRVQPMTQDMVSMLIFN